MCDAVRSLPVWLEFGIDAPLQAIHVALGDPDFVTFCELLLVVTGIVAAFSDGGGGIHGQLCVSPDVFMHILYFFCF